MVTEAPARLVWPADPADQSKAAGMGLLESLRVVSIDAAALAADMGVSRQRLYALIRLGQIARVRGGAVALIDKRMQEARGHAADLERLRDILRGAEEGKEGEGC